MSAEEKLTLTLSAEVQEALAYISELSGRTSAALVEEALRQFIDREVPIFEQIEEGMDDFACGRTVSHEDAMGRLRAHIAERSVEAA